MTSRPARLARLTVLLGALALLVPTAGTAAARPVPDGGRAHTAMPARAKLPPVRHVFVVNIENEGAGSTYAPDSAAPYLAKTLRKKGAFLENFYGTAHPSLPNYIAQISGQGPNPATHSDCPTFTTFTQVGTVAPDQAVGNGCVFSTNVDSLPAQMKSAHLSWKGYMDDMATNCEHPRLNTQDTTQAATPTHNYATRHNPFMYFAAVIGNPSYCAKHVQKLTRLTHDLTTVRTTPNLVYITPDLCNDGHDSPCADGSPGGLASVNAWMKTWIPKILKSPAFRKDGVLIVTTDEAESDDATACCGETAGPNSPTPGITGPGGGRIGALVLSRWVEPGTTSSKPYNHYSLLASIEAIFGLPELGYATTVRPFGRDVYSRPAP